MEYVINVYKQIVESKKTDNWLISTLFYSYIRFITRARRKSKHANNGVTLPKQV